MVICPPGRVPRPTRWRFDAPAWMPDTSPWSSPSTAAFLPHTRISTVAKLTPTPFLSQDRSLERQALTALRRRGASRCGDPWRIVSVEVDHASHPHFRNHFLIAWTPGALPHSLSFVPLLSPSVTPSNTYLSLIACCLGPGCDFCRRWRRCVRLWVDRDAAGPLQQGTGGRYCRSGGARPVLGLHRVG